VEPLEGGAGRAVLRGDVVDEVLESEAPVVALEALYRVSGEVAPELPLYRLIDVGGATDIFLAPIRM